MKKPKTENMFSARAMSKEAVSEKSIYIWQDNYYSIAIIFRSTNALRNMSSNMITCVPYLHAKLCYQITANLPFPVKDTCSYHSFP